MIFELFDAEVLSIDTDKNYEAGYCPTCDYGSSYINTLKIETTNYIIDIEIKDDDEYLMSDDFVIKLFCQNLYTFENSTEEEFIKLIENKIYDKFLVDSIDCTVEIIKKENKNEN